MKWTDPKSEESQENTAMVQMPDEEIEQTLLDQEEEFEDQHPERESIRPPNFVPVGQAKPIIDRDEVWVH